MHWKQLYNHCYRRLHCWRLLISARIILDRAKSSRRIDSCFVVSMIFLCGMGMLTLYSGSMGYASRMFQSPGYFIVRQAIFLAVGFVLMMLVSYIRLEIVRHNLMMLFTGSLILCLLTFIPGLGQEVNGATRWIGIGRPFFQPSELFKITLPLFLANFFENRRMMLNDFSKTVFPPALITGLVFCVVISQNDFSTSLFLVIVSLILFWMAGVQLKWFICLVLIVVPLMFFFVFTKEYRVERLLSFLVDGYDPHGADFQVSASLRAIGSGGFLGLGLGNGVRKIASIPMVHSDFIFAAWVEETGLFGVLLYFIILGFFTFYGFRISRRCHDLFSALLAFGYVTEIFLQSLINLGVVVKALPATGVTLPFFSAGGTSLVITMILCGFIMNISRRNSGMEQNL